MVRLPASMAHIKKRTADYRISNEEGWNRFAKSFLKQTEHIYSTFDVGRSMFDVHHFFSRLNWPFFWPAAGPNPGCGVRAPNLETLCLGVYSVLGPGKRLGFFTNNFGYV